MTEKSAASIGIIGGADGPTAVYRNNGRKSLKQKFSRFLYTRRRNRVVRTLRPEPHTLEEVLEYAKTLGYAEVPQDSPQYQSVHRQTKAALVIQHAPALLGELQEPPRPLSYSEEDIRAFLLQLDQRQALAEEVADAQFPMELHLLECRSGDSRAELVIEMLHEHINISASGSKKDMRHFGRTVKAIHRYYGVSQSDIDNQTPRFLILVGVLTTN